MKKIGYLVTLLALSTLVGGCQSQNKTESTDVAIDSTSTQLSSSKDVSQDSSKVGGCQSQNKTESTDVAIDSTSTQLSSSKDVSQDSSNNSTIKYLHGLEIGIGEITTANNKKDTKVVSIKVKVRNRSNEEQGVGSNDFKLKVGTELIDPYVDGINFGEAVLPEKSTEGIVSFEINKDVSKAKLIYQKNEAKQEWDLKL
ncbi:DUF4352 domain-containing protein [Enterococcus hirae]|nr:DUF4352 domain-containing protein [Enterococcus hirae]